MELRRPRHSSVATAMATASVVLVTALASAVSAQTLTDPHPKPRQPAVPNAAKAHAQARVKSCAAYGAGFIQVPGTDACIKVGGFVDGTVSSGR